MTLQYVSQRHIHWAQLATAGLLLLQATIATTTIGAFVSTQPVSAQALITK